MPSPTHVRRSSFVVVHWVGEEIVLENYALSTSARFPPRILEVMAVISGWTPVDKVYAALPGWSHTDVREAVAALLSSRILRALDERPPDEEVTLQRWHGWNPAVGLLHFTTKDVGYAEAVSPPKLLVSSVKRPKPLKEYTGSRLRLPAPALDPTVTELLLRRRTWRRFGAGGLTKEELSSLLGLTWGVQRWIEPRGASPSPLKTSPSGGARHSLEAYVVVLDIDGIEPGTYHYHADEHALELLAEGCRQGILDPMLPAQPWFHRPSAVVFMTSVFARVQWRYPFPRAYRVLHLEAGHFGQTFCLVATALGLAPFTTAALGDTAIERHLGIDGVEESVLYAMGVARPPEDEDWAPNPDGFERPRVRPPAWKARS